MLEATRRFVWAGATGALGPVAADVATPVHDAAQAGSCADAVSPRKKCIADLFVHPNICPALSGADKRWSRAVDHIPY